MLSNNNSMKTKNSESDINFEHITCKQDEKSKRNDKPVDECSKAIELEMNSIGRDLGNEKLTPGEGIYIGTQFCDLKSSRKGLVWHGSTTARKVSYGLCILFVLHENYDTRGGSTWM